MRHYLQSLNYKPWGWEQGFNFGPRAGVMDEAKSNLARTNQPTPGARIRTDGVVAWQASIHMPSQSTD